MNDEVLNFFCTDLSEQIQSLSICSLLTTILCQAATHYASIIDNMEFGLNWLVRPLYQNVMIEGIECF